MCNLGHKVFSSRCTELPTTQFLQKNIQENTKCFFNYLRFDEQFKTLKYLKFFYESFYQKVDKKVKKKLQKPS